MKGKRSQKREKEKKQIKKKKRTESRIGKERTARFGKLTLDGYYFLLLRALTTDTTKSPSTSTIRTIRDPCCFPQPPFEGGLSTGSGQVPLFFTFLKADP
ncbi:hypothetical protein ABZX51_010723 [Aspergillus tubingensis]